MSKSNSETKDRPSIKQILKKNLPENWYAKYREICKERGFNPKAYSTICNIKNGYFNNETHYEILQEIAQKEIDRKIEKNKMLQESYEKLQGLNSNAA